MEHVPGTRDALAYPDGGPTDEDKRVEVFIGHLLEGFIAGQIMPYSFPRSVEEVQEALAKTMKIQESLCAYLGVCDVVGLRPPRFLADARGLAGLDTDNYLVYMAKPTVAA